jgi:hypothetical protein
MFIPENVIKVKGTYYEQGKLQGEKVADIIVKNIDSIKRSISKSNINEKYYTELLEKNLRFIEEFEPDIFEEIRGISDGSGIEFQDIALINIPHYYMLNILPNECSSILARGRATFDGSTYLIKNRDLTTTVHYRQVEFGLKKYL